MTRIEVVLQVMLRLGGDSKGLDMEDIAIECHKISPRTFCWRKYPDQINLVLVTNALSDAKRENNGALVNGGLHQGWRLTMAGQEAAQEISRSSATSPDNTASPPEFRGSEGKRIKQEYQRITQSEAYAQWSNGIEITKKALDSLLKLNAYTSDELLEIKKTRLSRCRGIDKKVDAFLDNALR